MISKPRHTIDLEKLVAKENEIIICRKHKFRTVYDWKKKKILEMCVRCDFIRDGNST